MPRTREEIERRASALWAQSSCRLSAALDALPVGVVMLGVGMIALTASNRLPVWLALPTRDLQMALAGAGLSAGVAATVGAGVSAGLTFLALLAAYGLLLAAGQSAPPGWLRRAARWRGSGGCCCAGGCPPPGWWRGCCRCWWRGAVRSATFWRSPLWRWRRCC